jgi:hypothetical protein
MKTSNGEKKLISVLIKREFLRPGTPSRTDAMRQLRLRLRFWKLAIKAHEQRCEHELLRAIASIATELAAA